MPLTIVCYELNIGTACFAEISAFDQIFTDASLAPALRSRYGGTRPVLEVASV